MMCFQIFNRETRQKQAEDKSAPRQIHGESFFPASIMNTWVVAFILAASPALADQWSRIWGSSSDEAGRGLCVDASGNVYVAGNTGGSFDGQTNAGGDDLYVALVINVLDADEDGLPDAWENAFGLDPNNPSDAATDSDGDGHTNLEEYWAGTNPTNDTSVFKITDILSDTNAVITWSSVTGKAYRVMTTTNLIAPAWTNVTDLAYTNIFGTGLPLSYTNADPTDAQRFFHIRVRPE